MAGIQNIRDNLGSPFVKILTAAIVITFALFFGWGTVFSTSDANTVASINGKKIDVYDLDLEMARVQSILNQRFDDPDFNVEDEVLKALAINSLIRDSLVLDFLESNEVKVSNLTAYKLLAKSEVFQDEGKFSLQKVVNALYEEQDSLIIRDNERLHLKLISKQDSGYSKTKFLETLKEHYVFKKVVDSTSNKE